MTGQEGAYDSCPHESWEVVGGWNTCTDCGACWSGGSQERTVLCVYCRTAIRWEDTEYTKRWVHVASDLPLCRSTVATPLTARAERSAP